MKIKLIAAGVLVLIIAGSLGYFLLLHKTPSSSPTPTPTPTPELTGEVDQEITITAGEWVRVTLKNEGTNQHDWVLDKMPNIRTELVNPGESDAVEFTIGTKGEYVFYCSVPGHQE